jgi:hypothetical protein
VGHGGGDADEGQAGQEHRGEDRQVLAAEVGVRLVEHRRVAAEHVGHLEPAADLAADERHQQLARDHERGGDAEQPAGPGLEHGEPAVEDVGHGHRPEGQAGHGRGGGRRPVTGRGVGAGPGGGDGLRRVGHGRLGDGRSGHGPAAAPVPRDIPPVVHPVVGPVLHRSHLRPQ